MKNAYKKAMSKVMATQQWQNETLEKMQAVASAPPKNNTIVFKRATKIIAACAVIALLIPAAIDIGSSRFKMAQPMEMASDTTGENTLKSAAFGSNDASEKSAVPSAQNFTANENTIDNKAITQEGMDNEEIESLVKNGEAYLPESAQAGGYNADEIEILNIEFVEPSAQNGISFGYYKITAQDKNGAEIILTSANLQ